jgi:ABC-2 type transport system permease protein
MLVIFKKEIRSFFSSLVAYIVMIVFLTGTGLFMWVFPQTNVLKYGYADMDTLFMLGPYLFLFLIPAITMRSFAEEKKTGTIELLFTRPLTDWDIIIGKYLACWFLVIIALLPTLVYYYSVYQLGSPVGNIDSAGTTGSYIGLVLLGAVFTSIGIFASAITKDQIVSFVLAFVLCFLLFQGFSAISNAENTDWFSYIIVQLGIEYHYASIRKGLIDSRNIVYFLSVILFMLFSTKLVLGSRKW